MINEERTFKEFGYLASSLKPHSTYLVYGVCEHCGYTRTIPKSRHTKTKGRCELCARKLVIRHPINVKRGPFNIEYFQAVEYSILNRDVNELKTFKEFGYYSIDLSLYSSKKVYVICYKCGKEKLSLYANYNNYPHVCKRCSRVGFVTSDETKLKISLAQKGNIVSEERRRKISKTLLGRPRPIESRLKQSATMLGITLEERLVYIPILYPITFDNICKTYIRDKYNNKCFICNLFEENNIVSTGGHRKLSVHHIDRDKLNMDEYNLIPVCIHCHTQIHNIYMTSCITYIMELEKSKNGYEY